MAVAGAVTSAISTVSGISSASKNARLQREQAAIQEQALRDQKVLSDMSLKEQERQLAAESTRQSIMNNQAQQLGLLQLNMQEAQMGIEEQQQKLQRSQSVFAAAQRRQQREVESSTQLTQVMKALEQRVIEAQNAGDKQAAEEANFALSRLAQSGFNFTQQSQSDQAMNERMLMNLGTQIQDARGVDEVIETEKQQLEYEQGVARMEEELAKLGIDYNSLTQENQNRLGKLFISGSRDNINNQAARNEAANEYALQSGRGNINLQRSTSNATMRSQLATLDTQRRSVSSPGFADILGAVGGLGLQLYKGGVFGNNQPQNSSPYRVLSQYQFNDLRNQDRKWTNGVLFPETRSFERPVANTDYTGANDLIKGFS